MTNFLRRPIDPVLLVAIGATLFLAIPLAQNPGLPGGDDVLIHSYRVSEMQRSWEHGLFTPRWAEGTYLGYGSPLFHFYASLTYYLTSTLTTLFDLSALDALRWLLLLSLFMCSSGMYLFCKRRSGRLGGLIAGLVYAYSPYLMYTEPYVRCAFPELLAFALFPLLLWRIDAFRDQPTAISFVVVCLLQVALINAHNLMAATLTGIAFAWVIFETLLYGMKRKVGQMYAGHGLLALLAMLLGIVATATFWLPILLESDSVKLENLLVPGILDYRGHFVRLDRLLSPATINDAGAINGLQAVRRFGTAQWGLAVLGAMSGLALYIRGCRTSHPQTFAGSLYFSLLALALTALMLPATGGLWGALRPLQFLQFPWRLLGPGAVCLAIVASLNGLWLSRLALRYQRGAIALLVALPIVTAIPLLYVPEWRHDTLDTSLAAYHRAEQALDLYGTTATGEFAPRDVHTRPGSAPLLLADYADGYPVDKLNRATLPEGVHAEHLHNSPESLAWRIRATEPFTAEVYNFYWLGWRAEAEGRSLEITPSPHHGLITVALPAGDYELSMYLGSTPARKVATAISTLAIAFGFLTALLLCKARFTLPSDLAAVPLRRTEVTGALLGIGITLLVLLCTFREGIAWLNSPPGEALPAQVRRSYTFDESIRLLGYDLNGDVFGPGDRIEFTAYWYALEKSAVDFSSFLHFSSGGPPLAQIDKVRPGGRATSVGWGPEGYVRDSYEVELPSDLPVGEYQLSLGLYACGLMPDDDCGNGYRPTVRDESGEVIGDYLAVATITVIAK